MSNNENHKKVYELGGKLGITKDEIGALIEVLSNYGISRHVSGELAAKSMQKILKNRGGH